MLAVGVLALALIAVLGASLAGGRKTSCHFVESSMSYQEGAGQLSLQYSVDCSRAMESINIRGDLINRAAGTVLADDKSCPEAATCWWDWNVENLIPGCYRPDVFYDAKWVNPDTDEVHEFGGSNIGTDECL